MRILNAEPAWRRLLYWKVNADGIAHLHFAQEKRSQQHAVVSWIKTSITCGRWWVGVISVAWKHLNANVGFVQINGNSPHLRTPHIGTQHIYEHMCYLTTIRYNAKISRVKILTVNVNFNWHARKHFTVCILKIVLSIC